MKKNEEIADEWFAANCSLNNTLLALTGLRGTGKSKALERFVLSAHGQCGPNEEVFFINCENRLLRRIQTGRELWNYVCRCIKSERLWLFLDEISSFPDIVEFLKLAFGSGKCRTICVAASNGRFMASIPEGVLVNECRLLPEATSMRTGFRLDLLWDALFLRDVLNGCRLVDVQGIERVAEWVFDHMGEPVSLRRIGADLAAMGCRLSHNTAGTYLKSLQDAYLVERVSCWDVFEKMESKTDYCFICMDLELRRHHHGPAQENEPWRLRRALSYLDLRRRYDTVFTVRGGPQLADFMTLHDGKVLFWQATPCGAEPVLDDKMNISTQGGGEMTIMNLLLNDLNSVPNVKQK